MMKLHRLAFALLTGLAIGTPAIAQQEIVLRIGGGHPPQLTYVNQFDTFFVTEVTRLAKEKGHNVRFVKAWSGTVAKVNNTSEAVQKGALDIGLTIPTFEGSRLGIINFANNVAFGSTDYGIVSKIGIRMVKELPVLKEALRKDLNVELLAMVTGENYGMQLVKEVNGLDDLKGRKIGASYTTATWASAAGAVPIGIHIGEVAQALQTNLIEGLVIPLNLIAPFKLEETAKVWYKTDFGMPLGYAPIMNLNTRKRLPKDVVDIIDQVTEQTAARISEASAKREEQFIAQLKTKMKFIQITDTDKRRWGELLKDQPVNAARELDKRGLPGTIVFKTYIRLLKEAGHKFPYEYPL